MNDNAHVIGYNAAGSVATTCSDVAYLATGLIAGKHFNLLRSNIMEQKINISLTADEVNAVLQIIGNLPTSSHAYPLMMNIKGQADAQLKDAAEKALVARLVEADKNGNQ